mgnify:CR=1 FL=1
MSSYNIPGVHIKDVTSGSQTITQASSSVGILIGVARSGVIGVAQKIGSWTEFIAKYANGLDTPFLENSYLPYAVHGFFSNGGNELYVGSIKKEDSVKATKTSDVSGITVTASNEGAWGNDLKVSIKKSLDYNEDTNKSFDVTIALGISDSVVISDVTIETISDMIMTNTKAKQWLSTFSVGEATTTLAEEEFTLENGSDGSELTDSDYVNALSMIDTLDDVTFVAIPGQTSKVVNDGILAYCDSNGLFPIIDMPMGSTTEETKTYRKSISAWTGALCHPWGKMNDPLTNTLKAVPTAGHIMGVYARIIQSRGIHKAPAGVDAVVRGFVEMEYPLSPVEIGTLNPIGVICIVSKPNAGIVVWGARSLNSTDTTMRYVTDGLLNLNIKKSLYDGTQFAVFEANDETLWSRVRTTCKAFLESLRKSGALKGSKEEAYYVLVDSSNNTDDTISAGELHIEIGYAPVKPAEFIIIKLAHSIVSD